MKRVIIVGAGIAGLATALRLRQIGWDPLVVERAPARRTGGFAVIFSGMGYGAAERIGILPELAQRAARGFEFAYLARDGRPRFSVPASVVFRMIGDDALTMLRGDLEAVLFEAADAEIRFGATVTGVSQDAGGVEVTFGDGTVERADLLVGADGLHSTVRKLVFGPERDFLVDLRHMVGALDLERLPAGAAAGAFTTVSEVGRSFTVADLGGGRVAGYFIYGCPDTGAELALGPRRALMRAFPGRRWAVTDLLGGLDEDALYFDGVAQIVMDRWSRGRVVLVGDAAWCVSLFAGYGSSLAVGGADLLATTLEAHPGDLGAALDTWEAGLRAEVADRQRRGRANTAAHAPRNRLELAMQQLPLRLASVPPVAHLLRRHHAA